MPCRGRGVFRRVTLRATDPAASERCCTPVLPALGIADWGDFRLAQARRGLAWAY